MTVNSTLPEVWSGFPQPEADTIYDSFYAIYSGVF